MRRFITTALLLSAAATTGAETIQLVGGDIINAEVTAQNDEGVTIQHPSLGQMTIARDQIVAIYEDADAYDAAQAQAAAELAATELAAERAADDGILGTGFLAGWDRRFELGINGSEGNSQSMNFRTGFHGDFEDDEDRWLMDTVYRTARSDGATTENKFYVQAIKDWLIPEEDYFFFANGRFDWDEFQDWDKRISGFGGVGYQFLDNDTWNVRGRAGLGGNQEMGGTLGDEFTTEALLGGEVDYNINDSQSIAFTNYLYPSLEDAADFRNVTTLDYIIAIDRDKGVDLVLGLTNEYDSQTPATAKKNDFTYYISLVWNF